MIAATHSSARASWRCNPRSRNSSGRHMRNSIACWSSFAKPEPGPLVDEGMRSLADELRTVAGEAVWAKDLESAKQASRRLEPLLGRFNATVTALLPDLY